MRNLDRLNLIWGKLWGHTLNDPGKALKGRKEHTADQLKLKLKSKLISDPSTASIRELILDLLISRMFVFNVLCTLSSGDFDEIHTTVKNQPLQSDPDCRVNNALHIRKEVIFF